MLTRGKRALHYYANLHCYVRTVPQRHTNMHRCFALFRVAPFKSALMQFIRYRYLGSATPTCTGAIIKMDEI
jgi:hypothetical protein